MPEVHRFWYSSPLICSTHFFGQIRLIPDYLDLYHPKFHVSYRPLTLGQTLILNILDYQFRRKIVNPLRFCSFFQFYDIYSIYELFYIQYIASLLNILDYQFRRKIVNPLLFCSFFNFILYIVCMSFSICNI